MVALIPSAPRPGGSEHQLLKRIARTLGVGIDAFHANTPRHLLHTAEDGTQWFLASGEEGVPVVRRVGGKSGYQGVLDERVGEFFTRHDDTPQGRALAALIGRLLVQLR